MSTSSLTGLLAQCQIPQSWVSILHWISIRRTSHWARLSTLIIRTILVSSSIKAMEKANTEVDISYTIAALGLSQFGEVLPPTGPPTNQQFIASHIVPFGARFVTEVITCSSPINDEHLPVTSSSGAGNTTYIHIISNQRTIPLGNSFSICGNRVDGWCELNNFLAAEANRTTLAEYNYACFGNYTVAANANITDGRPNSKRSVTPQLLTKRSSMPVDQYDELMLQ